MNSFNLICTVSVQVHTYMCIWYNLCEQNSNKKNTETKHVLNSLQKERISAGFILTLLPALYAFAFFFFAWSQSQLSIQRPIHCLIWGPFCHSRELGTLQCMSKKYICTCTCTYIRNPYVEKEETCTIHERDPFYSFKKKKKKFNWNSAMSMESLRVMKTVTTRIFLLFLNFFWEVLTGRCPKIYLFPHPYVGIHSFAWWYVCTCTKHKCFDG